MQVSDEHKRILFLINSLDYGGAQRVMVTLLRQLSGRVEKNTVELALLDAMPRDYALPDSLVVHQLDARGSLLRAIYALYRLLRRERYDVVLSFLPRANIANVVLSRILKHKAIISERTHTSAHIQSRVARGLVHLVYPSAAKVIAVSRDIADDLAKNFHVPQEKITAISNPIDLRAIEAWSECNPGIDLPDRFIIGVGRLVPCKNFALLIEAFARSDYDGSLVIAGDGPERHALLEKIDALNLGERVRLVGNVTNIFPVLKRAEMFVSASDTEGFPNALVEAMALGVPAISADCHSGPSEILADRALPGTKEVEMAPHGILVPPGSLADLATAINRMQNESVSTQYGSCAARQAKKLASRGVVDEYWRLLSQDM